MKIIYLHQYFNTPSMSGGTRSYEMARRMVNEGHEVHVITSFRDGSLAQKGWFQTNEVGIHVHWLPVPYSNHMSYFQRIKAFLSFAYAARRKAIDLGGDIIFATSTPLTIALPAVLAAKKNNIPMVFEVRDLWPEMPIAMGALKNPILKFIAKKLEKWAYRNSEAIIALSPGMKEGIVRSGYPASKVGVVPNSSDNHEFQYNSEKAAYFRSERGWLENKPLLVYAGTFGKVNGVDYMVGIAKELKALQSDVRILLVGDGSEKSFVKQKAIDEGVYDVNLFIEDPIPKKDMQALLSAATLSSALFIDLPEMRPNSANKFFDTLASGTPVVLNYGGWMNDLVNRHNCGISIWQKTAKDAAKDIHLRAMDTRWLNHASGEARKLAEGYFDRDILAAQLLNVLESVADGRPNLAESIAPGIYQ